MNLKDRASQTGRTGLSIIVIVKVFVLPLPGGFEQFGGYVGGKFVPETFAHSKAQVIVHFNGVAFNVIDATGGDDKGTVKLFKILPVAQ